mgnify:CR=1 FL=1
MFAEEGPYHAVIIAGATLDTRGGPRIDAHARVLDVDGDEEIELSFKRRAGLDPYSQADARDLNAMLWQLRGAARLAAATIPSDMVAFIENGPVARDAADEYIEGVADRIEYNGQADTVKFTGRAVLRRDTRSAREVLALPDFQGVLPVEESARLASIGDDTVFLMESTLMLWKNTVPPLVGKVWCRLQPPVLEGPSADGQGSRDNPPHPFGEAAARLLPVEALERWRQERKVLDALPPRTNLLMQNTLDFVARFPSDPRAPRLLRETVHATRLDTCADPSAGALSEQAFNLLKRRYASSDEARRTKYWFKPGY